MFSPNVWTNKKPVEELDKVANLKAENARCITDENIALQARVKELEFDIAEKCKDFDLHQHNLVDTNKRLIFRVGELEASLNTEIGHSVRYEKERDELHEQLIASRASNSKWMKDCMDTMNSRDTLRTQLAEAKNQIEQLQAQNALRSADILHNNLKAIIKERDELHEELHQERLAIAHVQKQLAEANENYTQKCEEAFNLHAHLMKANEKLATLTPSAPTIWYQAVTDNSLVCCPCLTKAEADYEADGNILGYVVRTVYADGKVVVVLEAL